MDIVQFAIKTGGQVYLNYYSKLMSTHQDRLIQKQRQAWSDLRRSLSGTKIYNDLKLEYIETYEEFCDHVPARDFDFFAPYVESICQGEADVLFKGRPDYFGLSSGTSGQNSKRVPYNTAMMNLFIKSQRRVAARLAEFQKDINVLDVSRLAFGSAPKVYEVDGISYGYISGILSTKTPKVLKKKTFPSDEVLLMSDWDQKIAALIDEALTQDIQIVSGIPTYLISIFEAVLKKTGHKEIREIWPNLQVMVYAATPIKQYEDRLNQLVGQPLEYFGLYASTEAPIGLPFKAAEGGRQKYILNPDLLYTFSPLDNPARCKGLHNIEMNTPYYLNIATPNGFVNYAMKDQVIFHIDNDNLVFEFVGRKNTGMNLGAEKVSDDELLTAIIRTKEQMNQDIRHYFVAPTEVNGKPAYHWTLFVDVQNSNAPEKIGAILDQHLQQLNMDYMDCREVGVIQDPVIKLVCASRLQGYFEKNRNRGQFKMKTSFQCPEEFKDFMDNNFTQH